MKYKISLKKRCNLCKLIKRKKKLVMICTNKKHKYCQKN